MSKLDSVKLKYIPTKKIQEILEHPYCQGVDGADYEPFKEELQHILWEREQRETDKLSRNWAYQQFE